MDCGRDTVGSEVAVELRRFRHAQGSTEPQRVPSFFNLQRRFVVALHRHHDAHLPPERAADTGPSLCSSTKVSVGPQQPAMELDPVNSLASLPQS
jgi:hypothetical protein